MGSGRGSHFSHLTNFNAIERNRSDLETVALFKRERPSSLNCWAFCLRWLDTPQER